jgi:hypothetical protein
MAVEDRLTQMMATFTAEGTPLSAIMGNRLEWQATILTAAMISNDRLAASMDAEEMVDAAISYATIIQKRLGHYQSNQVHSLERMMEG